MFSISELHNDSPIFTSISSNDLYNLLVHIDHFHRSLRQNHQVRLCNILSLNEKIALVQSAERFNCNQVQHYAQGVLDDYYKKSTALDLLEAASNAKSIATGKIAILKMQEGGIYNIWFAVMKRLRATWQVEFHRLFWEPSAQLVNRPENEPERTSTGRRRPRTREAVFITTNRSFKEIAERFNPKSEG